MKITSRLMLAAMLWATFALSGCATITRGSTEAFTVQSVPLGATVSMSNGERCTTPCTLKLKRKHPVSVEVCKTGFSAVNTTIQSQVSGAGAMGMAGNVLIGGLIGVGVDSATGATKDLKPNPLVLQLVESAPGCAAPSFPSVPDGGQTPDEYWKGKKGKRPESAAAVAGT